ncbi:amino-acid N-acetyltransferase [Leeia sp. TBRC 13508]|uniref:Amino-acid acetyltransferase n=1 Tax=Leeia speluncae TaxID=2884804 RepID=A0ABS8D4D3_9NEIS|nr:amino-acid N-acetyltransferase [Leeia speluncae]MCB6182831.1 amino-acid N-acetyltransferase [Leeia speluncae]
MTKPDSPAPFVPWFREAAPYIRAFRGRTFVVAFGGDVVAGGQFATMTHDLNLLASLGVRLVLVHGVRPQVNERLASRELPVQYHQGIRITDPATMNCVQESIGVVRAEIEATLSMAVAATPMANASIQVAGGNFLIAQPLGVRDGIDMMHSGEVRKVQTETINRRLSEGEIVLISPIGYSPTGEIFNLTVEDAAHSVAIALKADKLIFFMDEPGLKDENGEIRLEVTSQEAKKYMRTRTAAFDDIGCYLPAAIKACEKGIDRVHLLGRFVDGALLMELFTREGVGTLITRQRLEKLRDASIDDVGGIMQLIQPLEEEGVLVKRSRELLEQEIERFGVLEHDGHIVGCVALYTFPEENVGELACLVVDQTYRASGYGDLLLNMVEKRAKELGLEKLFVLTTRTAHWFCERGFSPSPISDLPAKKQQLYNYQRRSKVFFKTLTRA